MEVLIKAKDLIPQEKENTGKYQEGPRPTGTSSRVLFPPHRTSFVSKT